VALPAQTAWGDLVNKFRLLGWDGPFHVRGRDHPFMVKGKRKQKIPNSHTDPVHVSLLKKVLHQAGISEKEWTSA